MPENDYRTHEILLENRHLALIGAGVLVLCVGSFLLGRWTERSRWVNPDAPLPQVTDVTGGLPIESRPADAGLAADDGQEGQEILAGEEEPPISRAAEPAPAARPAPAAAPGPRAEKSPQGAGGREDLYIQVLATRHAEAARALREKLITRDYPAAIVSSPDARGRPLYRVRVGGYESRREAEEVAARLEREEHLKTWIP